MRIERWLFTLPLRFRSLFQRSRIEREMQEELDAHVAELTAQYEARGINADDARTAALRDMGGIERRKEEIRSSRRSEWLPTLLGDIRLAVRLLRNAPAFTTIAVLTLALGTGANAAIFTVVNSVLLRPLPYGDPSRLVVIQFPGQETVAPAYIIRWQQAGLRSFEGIAAASSTSPTLTGGEKPEQLQALRTTPGLFPMMQVKPLLGRVFLPEEGHDGRGNVVVLSYAFWQRRFGGDSAILGKQLTIDGIVRNVVGVMPATFRFAPFWSTHNDFWLPQSFDGLENDRGGAAYRVFARLRPGISIAQGQAEIAALAARIKQEIPEANANVILVPLRDKAVGSVAPGLLVLLAAVALVLLIACANVTHLQLMRAASRERETAVRVALGASAARLVQQALVESLTLSFTGAALGLALAAIGVRVLVAYTPEMPRAESIQIDGWVLAFTVAVATLAGVVSGLIPAVVASRTDAHDALKEGARAGRSRRRRRTGSLLVVSEFAMAVVLLIGAGLVLRSFAAMLGLNPGFNPDHVIAMKISVRGSQHAKAPARGVFYRDIMTQVAAYPGVVSVGMVNHLPLRGDVWNLPFFVEGAPLPAPGEGPSARFGVIKSGYLGTMGIPLRAGRDIMATDETAQAHVVLVDEEMARANWHGADPIGQRLSLSSPAKGAEWFTVVGVVGRIQQDNNWSSDRSPQLYFPGWATTEEGGTFSLQSTLSPNYMTLVVRYHGSMTSVQHGIEQIVSRLDPDAPIADVITMDEAIATQLTAPRFYLILLATFASVALLLAAIGIYGVISHGVSARTREIGIRLALGAERNVPFKLFVREGVQLAVIGSTIGLGSAMVLTRYLQTLLYGVAPNDPLTLLAVPTLLIVVAIVACCVPAHRAARVSPMTALRGE